MRYSTKAEDVDSFRGGLRYIHGVTYGSIVMLTLFLYLYLLSPYFELGGLLIHGGMLSIILFMAVHPAIIWRSIQQVPLILTFIGLCLFCIYNLTVAIFYSDSFSTGFVNYVIQVAIYVLLGYSLAFTLISKSLDMDQSLTFCFKIISFVVFVNSVIIILEYLFPTFRNFVESMLYLSEESNIDYLTREFRLRGIASGGAANLSLFHGTILILLQALYIKHKIGFIYFLVASIAIFISLLFIGRTGIVLAVVGIPLFHLMNLLMSRKKVSLRRVLIYVTLLCLVVGIPPVLSLLFPDNLLTYSITFLYQGIEGIQGEGTTNSLLRMINIPDEWEKLLFGVGVHSGDFSLNRSYDLGYMRMLTALGIPVAALFYIYVAYLSHFLFKMTNYKSFWLVFLVIMFIAEIKEPFIFKGYSARLMWLLIGMGLCYAFIPPLRSNEDESDVLDYRV